mmetsp:Transcript_26197/g.61125  ORF Transcript_26197/g.61125 Transcript_26197/m.61125 type:complete len:527 (-) Transcript_26197:120-1700(-)
MCGCRRPRCASASSRIRNTLVIVTTIVHNAASMRDSGSLPLAHSWGLCVSKFCFDYNPHGDEAVGIVEIQVEADEGSGDLVTPVPQEQRQREALCEAGHGDELEGNPCQVDGQLYFALYDDEEDHWESVQSDFWHLPCRDKLIAANGFAPVRLVNGHWNWTESITEKVRPRFWYFAFIACNAPVTSTLRYDIHAYNVIQGPWPAEWQREVSIDKKGALSLQVIAALAFATLAVMIRYMGKRVTGTEAFRSRPLLRLLLMSCSSSAVGASLLAVNAAVYASDGQGWRLLEVIGFLWVCMAKVLLTILILLCAKGWALFYSEQELVERRLMVCLLTVIVGMSIGCEIYGLYAPDMSNTLYLYESGPGGVILALNTILFLEAFLSLRELHRIETSEEVRKYYCMISVSVLLYFMTLPITCILALAFDPWVRNRYVTRAEVMSRFWASTILCFCLRPSRLDAMINARLEAGLRTAADVEDQASPKRPAEDGATSRHPFWSAGGAADDEDDDQVRLTDAAPSREAEEDEME